MSNWGSAPITRAADAVREAMQGNLRSDYTLAKALKKLQSALEDGEFVRFLMDCDIGLAVAQATAYKFERMVSAVDVIASERVWERIGWDGVKKVVKITSRNERVNVCRAIVREKRPIGKQILSDLLSDHAPSYSAKRGSRSLSGGMTKARALHDLDVLKTTLAHLLKEYPVLRRELSEEVEIILELESGSLPQTQAG